jgi:hypothetical protein
MRAVSPLAFAGGVTPLCPAGHLPHKEGDRLGASSEYNTSLCARRMLFGAAKVKPLVISPLVGEMPGRAEGGSSTWKGRNSARKGQPQ